MPTGYTGSITDKTTFQQFAFRCARNFGALVSMRDDPADAPIPERFEASDYNSKQIEAAAARIVELNAMTAAEREHCATVANQKAIAAHANHLAEKARLRANYERILAEVEKWNPPTPNHTGMKVFMIEQLTTSIQFDCSTEYLEAPPASVSPHNWWAEQMDKALKDLEYQRAEFEKEKSRTRVRNEWLAALRDSLR